MQCILESIFRINKFDNVRNEMKTLFKKKEKKVIKM